MTRVWIIAASLVAVALAFVLTPLLRARKSESSAAAQPLNVAVYRDQLAELEADRHAGTLTGEHYERARLELEQRLLEDVGDKDTRDNGTPAAGALRSRGAAVVVGLAVPLLAVGLYFTVGTPRALAPLAPPQDASHGVSGEQIQAMVTKLAERMKQNPEDAKGWFMLGKSYSVLGRFDDAVAAYAQAEKRNPADAQLLADYADALAMANGRTLSGEPEKLVLRALKINPDHAKSLALAGTAAFDRKDYAGAIRHWERLVAQAPPGSEMARGVQSGIDEARGLLGRGALGTPAAAEKPVAGNAASAAPTTAGGKGVSGKVTLAPALAAKAGPGDTLFVFARAAQGPRMPLAILRRKVSDLPLVFTLDDSLAMSPQMRLSGVPQVIIGARISKSGDATPRSGDLQGASQPVGNAARDVTVVIDTEVQ
jgi:cytochrome c-type biogenesis protein CcmH